MEMKLPSDHSRCYYQKASKSSKMSGQHSNVENQEHLDMFTAQEAKPCIFTLKRCHAEVQWSSVVLGLNGTVFSVCKCTCVGGGSFTHMAFYRR